MFSCRYQSVKERGGGRWSGLPLHHKGTVWGRYPFTEVCWTWRIWEGLLWNFPWCNTECCQLRKDLCSQPSSTVTQDTPELWPEAIRSVCGTSLTREAQTEEDTVWRGIQGKWSVHVLCNSKNPFCFKFSQFLLLRCSHCWKFMFSYNKTKPLPCSLLRKHFSASFYVIIIFIDNSIWVCHLVIKPSQINTPLIAISSLFPFSSLYLSFLVSQLHPQSASLIFSMHNICWYHCDLKLTKFHVIIQLACGPNVLIADFNPYFFLTVLY